MEVKSLACDWCPAAARKPAVSRPALTNGRVDKPIATLDLCAQHQRELLRYFLPRGGQRVLPPGSGLRASAVEIERDLTRLVAWMGKQKEPVTRGDVARMLQVPVERAGRLLKELVETRKISARGKTAARRYTVRGEKQ